MKRFFLPILAFLVVPNLTAAPAKKAAPRAASPTFSVRGLALLRDGKPFALRAAEIPGLLGMEASLYPGLMKQLKEAGAGAVLFKALKPGSGGQVDLAGRWTATAEAKLAELGKAAKAAGVGLIPVLLDAQDQAAWAREAGSPNAGVFFRDYRVKKGFQAGVRALLGRLGGDALWACVAADAPVNEGGEPTEVDAFLRATVAELHAVSPNLLAALAVKGEDSPGFDAKTAAASGGCDFLIRRLSGTEDPKTAAALALQAGRPVVALYPSPPHGALPDSVAGALVRLSGVEPAQLEFLAAGLAALGSTIPSAPAFFTRLDAVAGPAPELRWEATAKVEAAGTGSAHWALRWGQGGALEHRLEGPTGAVAEFQLSNLASDQDLAVQAEAVASDGTTMISDRKSIHLPATTPVAVSLPPESRNFITSRDGRFWDGDKPYRYVGTNNYYVVHAGPVTAEYLFSHARALGMKVVRLWAFGEAASPDKGAWKDWEMNRYFVLGPGKYYEPNLKHLDETVAIAKKNGVRVILALANNWADFGGAPQWAAYFGYKEKDDFFDKPEVQKAFREYVSMLLNRVNTVTGVAYKDEPAIFAWDLMNEPQYKRDNSGKSLAKWVSDTTGFLKAQGARQMVTTGMEGFRASQGSHYSGTDFILSQNFPTVDFATYHIYPASEYNRWSLSTTEAVVAGYVKDAHDVMHKPVVMEEFGLPKNDPRYDKATWVRELLKTFYGAGGDGSNYWMMVDPTYAYGDGNDFDPTMTDTANVFAVTARELEAAK